MALELDSSLRQSFDALVVHTPFRTSRWQLPWSFSTFDYRELCALMWEQAQTQAETPTLEFETATVTGRRGHTVETDRGELSAPLVVDGLGWRRVLSNAAADPAPARASIPRPGGPPAGDRPRHGAVARRRLRARGLLVELSRRRRAACRRGLVLAQPSRQGADRAAGRRPRPAGPGLPGQLDPAPAAARGGGRRLLRRRLGRTLPAADRRGHPHRAVLRARVRA